MVRATNLRGKAICDDHYRLHLPAEEPRYEQRDRSASPRPAKRDDDYADKRDDSYRARDRSHSPNGRVDSRQVNNQLLSYYAAWADS